MFGGRDKRALVSIGWLFSERIARMAMGLLSTAVVARYLGPGGLGQINYAIALVFLISPFAQLGLVQTVTRELVQQPERTGLILGTAGALRLGGAVIGYLAAILAVGLLRPDEPVMHLLVLILGTRLLAETLQVITYWYESQVLAGRVVRTNLVAIAVSTLCKIAAVASDAGITGVALAFAVEPVLMAAGWALAFARERPATIRLTVDRQCAAALLRLSWPLFLSAFGAIINLKIDQVMLGQMSTDAEVGLYAAAVQLSEIWYFIPLIIMNSLFPSMIERRQVSAEAYNAYVQRMLDMMFALSFGVALLTQVAAGPVVQLLFGKDYAGAAPILIIHIWGSIFIFMRAVFSKWLIAESLTIYSLVTHFAGAAVHIGLNLLLIPRMGAEGAAIATVISYATSGYLMLFCTGRVAAFARMMTLAAAAPYRYARRLVLDRF